jgi:hypothetical protein
MVLSEPQRLVNQKSSENRRKREKRTGREGGWADDLVREMARASGNNLGALD